MQNLPFCKRNQSNFTACQIFFLLFVHCLFWFVKSRTHSQRKACFLFQTNHCMTPMIIASIDYERRNAETLYRIRHWFICPSFYVIDRWILIVNRIIRINPSHYDDRSLFKYLFRLNCGCCVNVFHQNLNIICLSLWLFSLWATNRLVEKCFTFSQCKLWTSPNQWESVEIRKGARGNGLKEHISGEGH